MSAERRRRRRYDPRLRLLIHQDGGDELARKLEIPRSTLADWKRFPPPETVAADVIKIDGARLQAKVANLERRIEILTAIMSLLLALLRVSGFRLDRRRLSDGDAKAGLLRAIERARSALPLRSILRVIGLSSSRYTSWKRTGECRLDGETSCPKTQPTRLTPKEVSTMREMTTSPSYRHVPTSTLAILAQRLGRVFAAPATWCRYARELGWRRPRHRVYPCTPKEGLRADRPDAMWHHDTTVIKLRDGQKVYLRAVIDNFSRRILAWWLGTSPEPTSTAALLVEATNGRRLPTDAGPISVMVDGGVENFNGAVDELVRNGLLKRILAQTDISVSNSMIEAFFRIAKHHWIHLTTSIASPPCVAS